MKATTFDEIVTAKTNARVQDKIKEVRAAVFAAIDKMGYGASVDKFVFRDPTGWGKLILGSILRNDGKWPKRIWEEERKLVAGELLQTMDVMQKAILSTSRKADPGDAAAGTNE